LDITIEKLIEIIPDWKNKEIKISPIKCGLTNLNYKIDVDNQFYFLSQPDVYSQFLSINFYNKYVNNKNCAEYEISPSVFYFEKTHNIIITDFVFSQPISKMTFQKESYLLLLIELVKKMHNVKPFNQEFNMFKLIKNYMVIINKQNIKLPQIIIDNIEKINLIGNTLEKYRDVLVPCHNDILPENILIENNKLLLIDFDYSGNNDPCFELGNLSIEMEFSEIQNHQMIQHYFGELNNHLIAKVSLHGIMSDYGWTLWSYIQHSISNIDFNFSKYGKIRLDRVVNKLDSSNYSLWMKNL
jgi:thiamine kinase-like enzyme